jgi:adenylyl cyclase-associated protein
LSGGAGGGKASTGGSSSSGGGESGGADLSAQSVVEFDALVAKHIDAFMSASKSIGGQTAEIAPLFHAAVHALRQVIVGATAAKKPTKPEDMMAFVKPLSDAMNAVVEFRNSKRGSKEWDHLSTVSEGVAAFGWVAVEPTPGPFATQSRAGAEFYSNKLLRQYKGKDETQMAWINAFTGLLKDMEEYIKNNHRTGLTFSGTGDAKAVSTAGAVAASGAPKAPPPMPKGPLVDKATLDAMAKPAGGAAAAAAAAGEEGGAARAGLFGELNRGGDVTKGLKKVTKDMQTHKNAALRAGG